MTDKPINQDKINAINEQNSQGKSQIVNTKDYQVNQNDTKDKTGKR